jgi:UDP-GlcNAc:undecaprenyl-phosphate/decaprenyl-phosphate GlcNAc-1-phosphate transferase
MGVFALPITVVWIVGIINAVNLIDGLDGLAAGVVFFAGLTNFIIACISGSTFVAVVMAATLGAVIGFLFYNFNPARIFMGDSGSYFLGYLLAATSLCGATTKASTAVSLLVPVVALGVPIFDTLFAMVRRILEKRSIFSPDRGHIHHRLLDMGITHRRAVLIIYGVSVVFTVSAIAISLGRSWHVGLAMLAASVVLVGLVRFVGYFEYVHLRRRQEARILSRDTMRLRHLMPTLWKRLDAPTSRDELLDTLGHALQAAGIGFYTIVEKASGRPRVVFRWTNPSQTEAMHRDAVTARYPIGRDGLARADIEFGWLSEDGDVSPQMAILLQVVVDMLELNLRRVRSPLAPRSTEEHMVTEAAAGAATLARDSRPQLTTHPT